MIMKRRKAPFTAWWIFIAVIVETTLYSCWCGDFMIFPGAIPNLLPGCKKCGCLPHRGCRQLEQNPWVQELLWKCGLRLESIMGQLQEAVKIAQMPRGPAPYEESLRASLETVKEIREIYYSNSWQDLFMALQEPVFGRFSSCTGDLYDPLLKNQATKMRDNCKAELKKIKEELFQRPLDEQLEDLKRLVPLLEALWISFFLLGNVTARRKVKRICRFSDLEHYALQILSQPDTAPDSLQPSEAALDPERNLPGYW